MLAFTVNLAFMDSYICLLACPDKVYHTKSVCLLKGKCSLPCYGHHVCVTTKPIDLTYMLRTDNKTQIVRDEHSLCVYRTFNSLFRPPGSVVPGGLMFYCRWDVFRHAFSEIPRPIAVKLCHMIGNLLSFTTQVQKFGGAHQKMGAKHAKIRSILCNLWLWSRISTERLKISKTGNLIYIQLYSPAKKAIRMRKK